MKSTIATSRLVIGGMTCINCQAKIERRLRNAAGVQSVSVSYRDGRALVTYDTDVIAPSDIDAMIQSLGYRVLAENAPQPTHMLRAAGLLAIIAALYFVLEWTGLLTMLVPGDLARTNMGYGMLFVIGLITSVHCVAMCGGISLSQCIPKDGRTASDTRMSMLRPTLLYNLGRVISYTVIGFAVGALGSTISFSNSVQGALKLIAGALMVVMGLNMLNIFPWLRKLNPRLPAAFAQSINRKKASTHGPLFVGLLNGLMPCGPLQAMQIYALSTANPVTGAVSMLLFSLGTVPLMFGLGALSSVLGRRFTSKAMAVGAVLVAVLGLSMFTQGLSLSGFAAPPVVTASTAQVADMSATTADDNVQVIHSVLSPRNYPAITVQAGIPVKWIIDAPEGSINGCNYALFIDEFGIEYQFKDGENVIEFTPETAGTYPYSCWMGMIRSTINVTS